jgi:hypothetical protein
MVVCCRLLSLDWSVEVVMAEAPSMHAPRVLEPAISTDIRGKQDAGCEE